MVLAGRSAGTSEVRESAVVGDLHDLVEVWSVDHEGAAEGDPHVVDPAGGAEEDEVAGCSAAGSVALSVAA
jgi:hypothetical protein